jgi:hypothetical protein
MRQHRNSATGKYRAGKQGIKFRNARDNQNANATQKKRGTVSARCSADGPA